MPGPERFQAGLTLLSAEPPFRAEPLANVRPLRPVRVLLAGSEGRHVRALTFLLGIRGYETRLSSDPSTLLDDAAEFAPDVVVLVAGGSFGAAVGQAMALIAESERLRVVVVTSRGDAPDSNELRFVPNWAPFGTLVEAVERAWAELPAADRSTT